MQGISMTILGTCLSAIRNLQLFQERLFDEHNNPVHQHESIRKDGGIIMMVELIKKRQAARARGSASPHNSSRLNNVLELILVYNYIYHLYIPTILNLMKDTISIWSLHMQSNICMWLHAGHLLTGRLYPSMMAIAQQRRASWRWPVGMAEGYCKALRRALREVSRIGKAREEGAAGGASRMNYI